MLPLGEAEGLDDEQRLAEVTASLARLAQLREHDARLGKRVQQLGHDEPLLSQVLCSTTASAHPLQKYSLLRPPAQWTFKQCELQHSDISSVCALKDYYYATKTRSLRLAVFNHYALYKNSDIACALYSCNITNCALNCNSDINVANENWLSDLVAPACCWMS